MKTKSLLARMGSGIGFVGLLLVVAACGAGSDEENRFSAPGTTYTPTTTPLGNFNVKCDQSPAQQVQQKIPYQQQQQQQSGGSCSPQFQFYSRVATDFDVSLDCQNNQVIVTGKGVNQSSIAIPIQSDGSWSGQVVVDQSVENDGQGNVFCKVKTIVNFDGSASCVSGQKGLTWGTTVDFAPAKNLESAALMALETSLPPESAPGIAASAVDPSPTPSSSPAPSASACPFSDPETVNTRKLEISIPEGAADLSCSAYGAGAYVVSAGTSVTWKNDDSQPHTVTADEGSGDSFDSGPILPGRSYTHVFTAVGNFTYHSTLDPNMQGQITVQQVSTPLPSATPTPTPTATISPVVPVPIPAPTPSPSPSASPSVSPIPSVTPSASPSPSPSPSVSPGTTPSPSATQIVSCVVVNPCPIYAQTTQKCPLPAQQ